MKKFKKRLTSILAAALMVVSMIPTGNAVEALADEITKVLDATQITATGADKDLIAEGTTFADGYFKIVGEVQQRLNDDGTVKALDTAKKSGGAIQFTVTGTADVSVVVSSNGGANTSAVALVNADGKELTNNENVTTVSGSADSKVTLTYTGIPAGTYRLLSPETADYGNRGVRVYSVSVTEGAAEAAVPSGAASASMTYSFDATTLDATGVTDKDPIAEGTKFGDYFKVIGTVTQRVDAEAGTTKYIEVGKNGTGSITFTTNGSADVKMEMSSTGGTNVSAVALIDDAGNVIANAEGVTEITGTGKVMMSYTGLAAGTYHIVSPQSDYNRGARVHTIVVNEVASVVTVDYAFDATTIDATGVTDKDPIAEGTKFADYFKVIGTVTQRVDAEKVTTKYIEVAKNGTGSVSFTVNGTADAKIEMSSTGGTNVSAVALIDDAGNVIANAEGVTEITGTGKVMMSYTGLAAGNYHIVSPQSDYNRGARVHTILVTQTSGGARPARADWNTVAAPEITEAVADGGSITVSYKMVIGYDGADKIAIDMVDAAGNVLATESAASDGTSGTVTFNPSASGNYTFKITASRDGETDKVAESAATAFVLPLGVPACSSATSQGGGKVSVVWSPVDEATEYIISYEEKGTTAPTMEAGRTSETEFVVEGLTIDCPYVFYVQAVRGEEVTEAGTIEAKATKDAQRVWVFSAFGSSTNTKDNWYEGNANEGSVTVASLNGKGKIVPNSTDGIAFYYTKINPETENFKLSATIHVDEWKISNGQDGFGMMVADAVGEHGDSGTFWNNYFSAVVSKVEYWYDPETDTLVTHGTGTGNKISMKLGVGSQQKIGVTAANIADGTITTNINELFDARTTTFETSQKLVPGTNTFNIVGNATNDPEGTLPEKALLTEFKFTIERNNTGYFLSYDDPKTGETVVHKYYDIERTALTQIDPDNIYVGFFASRNAKITVTDIVLTTSDPATDAPAEGREVTTVPLVCDVISAGATGNEDYELIVYTNATGTMTVKDGSGNVIAENLRTEADAYTYVDTKLAMGQSIFNVEFTPDADFKFSEYEVLSSYEPVKVTLSVMRRVFEGDIIYVAPQVDSSATGKGTKESPTDINTAVKYVRPGQVILLAGGRYWEFLKTVTVERGNDGTADAPIYLMADPEATERPVLDFEYNDGKGMTIAGDYWILDGFDITNTADMSKGLQIAGNNCIVQNVNTYNNGNTGLQISRYKSTDYWNDWPANNLILNCTSYNNADHGYEDADGFAAKLTIADGNVFDGCVAYNNADDGWDLFAKVETGSIGAVVMRNCIAYANGYLSDGTDAGNGNGFKMGGDSMAGAHQLINCVAYDNKAKGIDSNSGPDVQVINCTSFNNGSYNVALYTNNAANTSYVVDGVISFRTENMEQGEQLKLKGTQEESKVYGEKNFYYNAETQTSANSAGTVVDASWFVNLDTATLWSRNEDGSINMNGLLELTDAAPAGTGAVMSGQANVDYGNVVKELQAKEETAKAEPTKAPSADGSSDSKDDNKSDTASDSADAPASSASGVSVIVVVVIAVVAIAAVVIAAVLGKKKKNKK